MRRTLLIVASATLLFTASRCDAQIFHKDKDKDSQSKSQKKAQPGADTSAEPDKVLYDRAMNDIRKGKHEVGRLSLQTLINTYPDSEYLAKAKLAIADSYYKEGGSANMTQAIAGYKDFIVFFPFLPEAAYAQIQVAMAHYKQLEKPDRDRSEAKAAEDEFQTFLQKYPKDPLVPKAEQHLRDVQEILAEGDYRIGYYYYVKGDRRAAAGRLISVTKRYPLYSRSDKALWMLGDIFEKSEHKEIAATYYAQIVRNYPLSPLVGDAKTKLKAFNVPVPQPDPTALSWMQAEANADRGHERFYKKPLALIHSGPGDELRVSARYGTPNLEPESESSAGTDILTPTGKTQIGVSTVGSSGSSSGPTTDSVVDVATPGSGSAPSDKPATDSTTAPPNSAAPPEASSANPATSSTNASPSNPTDSSAKPDASAAPQDSTANGDASKTNGQANGDTTDPKKESTSKKKKGIKKLIPW